MPNINNKNDISVKPLPEFSDTFYENVIVDGEASITIDEYHDVEVGDKDEALAVFNGIEIDRTFTIVGSDRSTLKVKYQIGRIAKPGTFDLQITTSPARCAPELILQPATAGAASAVKDRGYVAAIQAINTMFAVGSEAKVATSVGSTIAKIHKIKPDPTRLFVRLMQDWLARSLDEAAQRATYTGWRVKNTVHVNTLATITGMLRAADSGMDTLVVDLDPCELDHTTVLSVLQIAVSGPRPRVIGVHPTICSMDLRLSPDMTVHYLAAAPVGAFTPNVTATDIWLSASFLASQWGCTPFLQHALGFVLSLAFSTKGGKDEIFSSACLQTPLPVLNLRHYALLPFALACDALFADARPPEPNIAVSLALMTVRNQLLSVAYGQLLYDHGVNAFAVSTRWSNESQNWLRTIHTGGTRATIMAFNNAILFCQKQGWGVCVGPLTALVRPVSARLGRLDLLGSMLAGTQFEELADVVTKLPMAALDAVLRPKHSVTLLQPKVRYKLDAVGALSQPATLALLNSVGATLQVATRGTLQLNWVLQPVRLLASYRGALLDHALPKKFEDKGTKNEIVFELPNTDACIRAYELDQLRRTWKWYITGTELQKLEFDPAPSWEHTPPNTTDILDSGGGGGGSGGGGGGSGGGGGGAGSGPRMMGIGGAAAPSYSWSTAAAETASVVDNALKLAALQPALALVQEARTDIADSLANYKLSSGLLKLAERSVAQGMPVNLAALMTTQQHVAYQTLADTGDGDYALLFRTSMMCQYTPADPAKGIDETFTPHVNAAARPFADKNLSEAFKNVPLKRRSGAVAIARNVAIDLLARCTRKLSSATLANLAARLDSLSQAMDKCPALTLTELESLGYSVSGPALDSFNNYQLSSPTMGISLDAYANTKPGAIIQKVPEAELSAWLAKGFKKSKDQSGAPAGQVLLHKQKVLPPVDVSGIPAKLVERGEKLAIVAEELLGSILGSKVKPLEVAKPEMIPTEDRDMEEKDTVGVRAAAMTDEQARLRYRQSLAAANARLEKLERAAASSHRPDVLKQVEKVRHSAAGGGIAANPVVLSILASKKPLLDKISELRVAIGSISEELGVTYNTDKVLNELYADWSMAEPAVDAGSDAVGFQHMYLRHMLRGKPAPESLNWTLDSSLAKALYAAGQLAASADGGDVAVNAVARDVALRLAEASDREWGYMDKDVVRWQKIDRAYPSSGAANEAEAVDGLGDLPVAVVAGSPSYIEPLSAGPMSDAVVDAKLIQDLPGGKTVAQVGTEAALLELAEDAVLAGDSSGVVISPESNFRSGPVLAATVGAPLPTGLPADTHDGAPDVDTAESTGYLVHTPLALPLVPVSTGTSTGVGAAMSRDPNYMGELDLEALGYPMAKFE